MKKLYIFILVILLSISFVFAQKVIEPIKEVIEPTKETYEKEWDKFNWSNTSEVNVVRRTLSVDSVTNQTNIEFMGTYYEVGDAGKTFLQLTQGEEFIDNAFCDLTIYNPDNSLYLYRTAMTYLNDSAGLYYFDFTVPDVQGVYMLNAFCGYERFFLNNNVFNFSSLNYISGSVGDLLSDDGSFVVFDAIQVNATTHFLDVNVTFEDVDLIFYPYIDTFNIDVNGDLSSTHDLNISIFNYDSGLFEALTNNFLSGISDYSVSNILTDVNFSNYVNVLNQSKIGFNFVTPFDNHSVIVNSDFYDDDEVDANKDFNHDRGNSFNVSCENSGLSSVIVCGFLKHSNNVTDLAVRINNYSSSFTVPHGVNNVYSWKCVNISSELSNFNFGNNIVGFQGVSSATNVWDVGEDKDRISTEIVNYETTGANGWNKTWKTHGSGSHVAMIRLNYSCDDISSFDLDEASLTVIGFNQTPIETIRGGGELNVKDRLAGLEGDISNVSALNLANYLNLLDAINEANNSIINTITDVHTGFSMNTFGTDYQVGENGRVFVQLVENNTGFNNAICTIDIYTPSTDANTSVYFAQGELMSSVDENGFYFYDFIAPAEEGIYMTSANCFTGQNTTIIEVDSDVLLEGSVSSGSISDISSDNGVYYELSEQNNGGNNRSYQHDFYFNISSIPLNATFTAIVFEGRLNPNSAETVNFQLFNFSNSEFVVFPNVIESQDSVVDIIVSQTGSGSGIADFQNASGFLRLRLQDTLQVGDTSLDTLFIDSLGVGATFVIAEPVIGIQGGAELNVRDHFSDFDFLNQSLNLSFNDLELFIELKHNASDVLVREINNSIISFFDSQFEILNLTIFNDFSVLFSLIQNESLETRINISAEHTITRALITSSVSGVSSQITTLSGDVSSLDSDLSLHDIEIKDRLDDLEFKIDWIKIDLALILSKLNVLNNTININANAIDCQEGANWNIEVTVQDQFANFLNDNDVSCNVTTNLFGTNDLVWDGDSFDFSNVCGFGNDTITWVVDCVEI